MLKYFLMIFSFITIFNRYNYHFSLQILTNSAVKNPSALAREEGFFNSTGVSAASRRESFLPLRVAQLELDLYVS